MRNTSLTDEELKALEESLTAPSVGTFRDYMRRLADVPDHQRALVAAMLVLGDSMRCSR
jgi:hypothetical protein